MEYNHEWAERSRRQKILETKWEKPEKCGFELIGAKLFIHKELVERIKVRFM